MLCDHVCMTPWQSLVRDMVHRIERDFWDILDGLDPSTLDAAVTPGMNSIGWLLWHLTRSHDRNFSELCGVPQLWLADGWHERFDRAGDPSDTGYGHSPAEAAGFRSPDPEVLIGYHGAVVGMIDEYLDGDEDLARLSGSPTLGDVFTVQERLVGVLVDALQHVGQAALLRGALEGAG
jgi:hypothetical protein